MTLTPPSLAFVLFLAGFIGLAAWSVRHSRKQEKEKVERLTITGFTKETDNHKQMSEKWGTLEKTMFRRTYQGYTIWHLEEPDSEGPSTPFLAIEFTEKVAHPDEVWIVPAIAKEGGMAVKMFNFMARLAGRKHRLKVPFPLGSKWWVFSRHSTWQPAAPPEELWNVLRCCSPLSVKFQKEGLRLEAQPASGTYKSPDRLALLNADFISMAENIAEVFVGRK